MQPKPVPSPEDAEDRKCKEEKSMAKIMIDMWYGDKTLKSDYKYSKR